MDYYRGASSLPTQQTKKRLRKSPRRRAASLAGNHDDKPSPQDGTVYAAAFRANPAAVAIVRLSDACIIDVSDTLLDMLGYARDEIIGRRATDLRFRLDPQEIRRLFESIKREGRAHVMQFSLRAKNGTFLWTRLSARPIDLAGQPLLLIALADQSEYGRAEDELNSSQRILQIILDTIPQRVFWKDTSLRFLGCNKSFALDAGFDDPAQIIGRDDFEMGWKEEAPVYRRDDRTVMAADAPKLGYEEPQTTPNGDRIWLRTSKVPLHDREHKVIGILGTYEDITAQKQAQDELRQSVARLRDTMKAAINALSSAIEMRDPYTTGHQERVARLACSIAREMGLAEEQIEAVQVAGIIHDIGKIAIPAEIMSRPARLREHEDTLIRMHPQVGYTILSKIDFPWPIAEIVRQHHERLDGSGYPRGLAGPDILLEARILSVADVVEAMSSHRPYRPSLGLEQALSEITANRGRLYDPAVVETCRRLIETGQCAWIVGDTDPAAS